MTRTRAYAITAAAFVAAGGFLLADRLTGSASAPLLATGPQGIILPSGTAYVRLMPGCRWGNGTRTLTISRKPDQAINVVNLGTGAHYLSQTAGAPGPMTIIPPARALALSWRAAGVVRFTTCSGTVKLTVTVK